jgi:threonine dehydratase
MPVTTPALKVDAVKALGGEVLLHGDSYTDAYDHAVKLCAKQGLTFIHPFDDPEVIAGQGTAAKELIEDVGPLDYLLVPCGGGGLISGSAIAANYLSPGIQVIGVEPAAGDEHSGGDGRAFLWTLRGDAVFAGGRDQRGAGRPGVVRRRQRVDEDLPHCVELRRARDSARAQRACGDARDCGAVPDDVSAAGVFDQQDEQLLLL